MVGTYGQDAVVGLINSYADGKTDDEAFRDALGVDAAAFDAAWIAAQGASMPERTGPQPAPVGPLPSGWTAVAASPAPAASAAPSAGASPTTTPTPEPEPGPGDATGDGLSTSLVVVFAVLLIGAVVVGVTLLRGRRQSRAQARVEPAPASPASDEPLPSSDTPSERGTSQTPDR
jgi:hypothetical protein